MSSISTHILDTSIGRPAVGVKVRLEAQAQEGGWKLFGQGVTDANGRLASLAGGASLQPGTYRLVFSTAEYFAGREVETFYPEVAVSFHVGAGDEDYHVPLLVSPYGFSTYRGS